MGIGNLLERANSYAKTNTLLFRPRGAVEGSGILIFLHKRFDANISEEDLLAMKKYTEDNRDSIKKVRDMLFDEKSRKVYDSVIEYRCTGNKRCIIHSPDMYFPKDIFKLSKEEVFVDCGSFSGDTIFEFIRQTRGRFKAVYAFEPGLKHYDFLKKNVKKLSRYGSNFTLINEGVWSECGQLCFIENEVDRGTSHISIENSMPDTGETSIKVSTLDSVLSDKNPTLIKMDIEGAELEALKGAKEVIKRYRPGLAICIYHKSEDFVDIPVFIKELVPEYNLYVRHHSCGIYDTVLYAVV